jgi:hypothetical protein
LTTKNRRAIINSVKQWTKTSQTGITSILNWIGGSNSAEKIAEIHSIQRNNLINDGRRKKQQCKQTTGRQKSIASRLFHSEQHDRVSIVAAPQ